MRKFHGLYKDPVTGKKSRLYHIWEDMKNRCYNVKNRRYHSYGGRGIIVCEEWKNDYRSFYAWSKENGYADSLTIDRENVDGNYEPGNCRWATQKEQGNNRTNNRLVEWNGVTKTLMQWANDLGFDYHVLKNRLLRNWTIDRAFTTKTEKHTKRAA
jgi:hypothetical protein